MCLYSTLPLICILMGRCVETRGVVCVCGQAWRGDHRSHYKCIIIINNMKDEYIEIRKTKKMGRGIFAKQNIQPGTLIMIVYKQNFITYERVKQQSIFWQIEQQIGCKLSCFAYFLCYCQNMGQNLDQLQIIEYINQLPPYFHNLLCWNQQQLHLIQNQTLVRTVKQKRLQYIAKYHQIRSLIQQNQAKKIEMEGDSSGSSKRSTRIVSHQMKRWKEGTQGKKMRAVKETTLEQFFKFIAVIKSRNIYWANEEDKRSEVGALIPYLQLFNHSPKSQCKVQPNCAGEKVITIKEIHKGEEVFVKYADNLSVESCLLDYGMMDLTVQEYHGQESNFKEQWSKIHSQRVQLVIRYNRYRQKLN